MRGMESTVFVILLFVVEEEEEPRADAQFLKSMRVRSRLHSVHDIRLVAGVVDGSYEWVRRE